jgi:hypothetical protein
VLLRTRFGRRCKLRHKRKVLGGTYGTCCLSVRCLNLRACTWKQAGSIESTSVQRSDLVIFFVSKTSYSFATSFVKQHQKLALSEMLKHRRLHAELVCLFTVCLSTCIYTYMQVYMRAYIHTYIFSAYLCSNSHKKVRILLKILEMFS